MTAPAYSFARGRSGRPPRRAKLHRLDVAEMRRWVRREGYGLSLADQTRILRARYGPCLSLCTLRDILENRTWADPTFTREIPDPEWATLPIPVVAMLVLRRA